MNRPAAVLRWFMNATNPLRQLARLGQAVWLDFIERELITGGGLQKLIAEDGLRGVTSNPAIFEKVITGTSHYADRIAALTREGRAPFDIYDDISRSDVQEAADIFRPLYRELSGADGFVSLEVNPHVALETAATVSEARRLWRLLNRSNVFIKVPATREGVPAIEQLISEGINVNVTLIFGLTRYREVAEAYVAGLEKRRAAGASIESVASVASFFVSRIDALVDSMLDGLAAREDAENARHARALRGNVAIACAKEAYQIFREIFGSPRFQKLAQSGARAQRLLWASTGTKDPTYSDVKYVDGLIGPDTVNTMPLETLEAFRDHGSPRLTLEDDLDGARKTLSMLRELGLDLDDITMQLEEEGVTKFNKPFDALLTKLSGS